jgi:tRNA-2-methylthio-N6-dimethylallyladenosine synthase
MQKTQKSLTKKLYIKTYGCQMNVYDSERMEEMLAPLGYTTTDAPDDADMVVLNTCHIREKASEKLYSALGRLRPLKEKKEAKGEKMVLTVAGCVAQAEGEEMKRRVPYVDIIVGPQTYQQLPDLVAKVRREEEGEALALDFKVEEKFDQLPEERMNRGAQAFLTIQEGCDKFCTYCVVPYTRGAEYSRDVQAVMAEARGLVDGGAREITLLGQNVNAYHGTAPDGSEWGLGRLIMEMADRFPELKRIRYTTSHPKDMDAMLIRAHGEVEVLMPFLHLPVQSGSNRILKAMNRKHSAMKYLDSIEKAPCRAPGDGVFFRFYRGIPWRNGRRF